MKVSIFKILGFVLSLFFYHCQASPHYKFVVKEVPYTRLCSTKNILTINGQYPGPTLYVHKGDTIVVDVYNRGNYNITIHWHGVKQPGNPWTDGPEYITQCPIAPGAKFRQKIILTTEEGTLWWHAHSQWLRATVYGAMIIYPKLGTSYPFAKPDAEIPILLGDWWIQDIVEVVDELLLSGGEGNYSNAFTINGQPGDLYPCSKQDTFRLKVERGLTYLLRIINSAVQDMLFFSIAGHNVTLVGSDASYLKPLERSFFVISPGQTFDVLLEANQSPNHYYMAAKSYTVAAQGVFDNTTTTAIVEYSGNYTPSSPPLFPYLPEFNDTYAAANFTGSFRSLADKEHPIDVPMEINTYLFHTLSMNTVPCPTNSCSGPNGNKFLASVNNISFVNPEIDILEAYYYCIPGVFGTWFPDFPPLFYNFTADDLPGYLELPTLGTEVKILEYNSTVELVFQGTNLFQGSDHPMHLHGFSFYVVGVGLGNFDNEIDPLKYNLVDPPLSNTIIVPSNGWLAIRFKADNPGVWYMHCHFDRHMLWGMDAVFIVKNGESPEAKMSLPPSDMPSCYKAVPITSKVANSLGPDICPIYVEKK
ncbi:hypothetical protein SLEP1_g41039 [Rubroshorea leprosula]|uniref:Laccase n=1 Tax=Rubroshorea leprosula TaxID=152421 RepID=A0AAV5L6J8_9ROSI|nr:hypothetical protein SLEP1_g41038 [Rubroshorea leprosula]GKV32428.1 hypothetical protein SLEP1_g41039 [Rubroshorea leprosula]